VEREIVSCVEQCRTVEWLFEKLLAMYANECCFLLEVFSLDDEEFVIAYRALLKQK
jgi:hypothetical protein